MTDERIRRIVSHYEITLPSDDYHYVVRALDMFLDTEERVMNNPQAKRILDWLVANQ